MEERDAGGIVLLLALELQAARDVRGRVEVEPLGDGRRQPVERPAPLAQRPVAARALLDAEVGDRVGDGRVGRLREAARLRHRGVEEDRRRVARGVRRRPHHAHGLAVPHLREARRRDGERAADLDLGNVLPDAATVSVRPISISGTFSGHVTRHVHGCGLAERAAEDVGEPPRSESHGTAAPILGQFARSRAGNAKPSCMR